MADDLPFGVDPTDLPEPDLSENARTVLAKRYLICGEDGEPVEGPRDMFWRVASTIAAEEEKYEDSPHDPLNLACTFYRMMSQGIWMPNSPTLTGAGRDLGMLSACFVLPVEDTLENGEDGIYDTLLNAARVFQAGGGVGYDFSKIRPSGSRVKSTTGVASGPVTFMQIYDESVNVIEQGGHRRGAQMGILRCDHPDILEFIDAKRDTSKLTNFNISVAATDEFMEAARAGEKYDLVAPHTGKVVDRIDASMVLDRIIENAHASGEPGLFFIDRANEDNPIPHLGDIQATNPCVVGSTRLATDRGLLTMEELERETMEIRVATDDRVPGLRSKPGHSIGDPMFSGGDDPCFGTTMRHAVPVYRTREDAEVFRLVTEHGYEVTATADHEFYTPHGPVELRDLSPGDTVLLQSGEGAWSTDRSLPDFEPAGKYAARVRRGEAEPPEEWSRELGQVLGWIVADGFVSEPLPDGRAVPNYSLGMTFGGSERELMPELTDRVRNWTGTEGTVQDKGEHDWVRFRASAYYLFESLGLVTDEGKSDRVPDALWRAPREAVVGFLQALFTADGTVNRVDDAAYCSVRLASSNRKLLREVQTLLANLGIVSRLYLRREAGEKEMPDGHGGSAVYSYRDQYELIVGGANRDRFAEEVGFLTRAKQEKVEEFVAGMSRGSNDETFNTRIESVEPAGRDDVYCTTEPSTHSIVVNGLTTANCGEIPLPPYGVCNLGHINLAEFVGRDVDWEGLAEAVHLGVRFLDNVIDANNYPLEEIRSRSDKTRRIGHGVMGWADALVQRGLAYDDEGARAFADEVAGFIHTEAERASEQLAEERGPFPAWTASEHETPRRNAYLNTVAPTGTTSIIAGCSGGIEPLYAVAFMRNQAGELMPEVNDDFVALAKEEGWHSEELMERVAEEGSVQDIDEVPARAREIFKTAHDVAPSDHIKMQAAWQRFTEQAISKTCNYPQDATPDDVREGYMLAHELDCKGVTVYRDGSREGQALSVGGEDDESDSASVEKRERPAHLEGCTKRQETPLGRMYVTINEQGGEPFEVFVNLGKAGGSVNAHAEAVGRLISLALRYGIPLEEVHEELLGISSDRAIGLGPEKVGSMPHGIAQVLGRFLGEDNGTEAVLGKTCPECQSQLRVQEGCEACPSCGYSECG